MKRITPNLKKLVIHSESSDIINAMLENLENLEFVVIDCWNWKLPVNLKSICPNIIHLYMSYHINSAEDIEQLTKDLLRHLKQLKTLSWKIDKSLQLRSTKFLRCIRDYGKNLELFETDIRTEFQCSVNPAPYRFEEKIVSGFEIRRSRYSLTISRISK
jgi:hypothetical protein